MNNRNIVLAILAPMLLMLFASQASAQSEHPVSFNVGGGYTPILGKAENRLQNGWNMTGGVAYNFHSPFSIGAQFLWNGLGVSRTLLNVAGAPNGDANVWAITAEPRVRLPIGTTINPYIVGGVGYYRRTVHFTQPTLEQVAFFDPIFGVLFPGVVNTLRVLNTSRQSGIGGNLGAGFQIGLGKGGVSLFTEARYHYANTGALPTRLIPVTIGLRF